MVSMKTTNESLKDHELRLFGPCFLRKFGLNTINISQNMKEVCVQTCIETNICMYRNKFELRFRKIQFFYDN
jgi:hypothetical protein